MIYANLLVNYFQGNHLTFEGNVSDCIETFNKQSLSPYLYYVYGNSFFSIYLASVKVQERFYNIEKQLNKIFDENSISHFYIKGTVLSKIYPDSALRTRGDIDVVIKEEDEEQVTNLLLNNGFEYESKCFHHIGFKKNNLEVEVHTKMLSSDFKIRDLIYSYNDYNNYEKVHASKLEQYMKAIKQESNLRLYANNFLMILNYAMTALIIVLGAYYAYKDMITYGFIIALLQIVSHIANPIISASSYISSFTLAKVSNNRLQIDYCESVDQIDDFDYIVFENVSYEINNQIILKDFSYKIFKDDIVRIVGDSGSGKSTIIKLLLGIITPSSGFIYYVLNGKKYSVKSSLNLVSYLNQEITLINASIKDNFLLYSTLTEEEIYSYIDKLNLGNRISNLDELINNEELNLSVGEKQRLMFAIMLSTNRKIIILDEFDSNLDKNNTNVLLSILNNIEKTIIYVSHKDSIIEKSKTLEIKK